MIIERSIMPSPIRTFALSADAYLYHADCRDALAALPADSLDSCVTDPPYFMESVVRRFGGPNAAPAKEGSDGRFARLSGGFMLKQWDSPDTVAIDPGFAHWFAGFTDGEGCFSVHKKNVNGCETFDCQFSINLRDDDKPILVEIQQQLGGIGSLADRPGRDGANPQARYCISSKTDCQKLRALFDVFPLRAKKARDFQIWSAALDAWREHEPGAGWDDVAYYRNALMAVKKYGALMHPTQLWSHQVFREVLRVLKPGGHMVAFGSPRGYHRIASGIEDAGFEIRDSMMFLFGTGFPKSQDVSKFIDRELGCEREKVSPKNVIAWQRDSGNVRPYMSDPNHMTVSDVPISPQAIAFDGWGTALKPAYEPILLCRKPLREKTVAANVRTWGTGAININACRIERKGEGLGRWPTNLCHDSSGEVIEAFPQTGGESAARFFYSGKASKSDKQGTNHPTTKPTALMQWLSRLVTPPGGVVIDPFAGSGSTGIACIREGFKVVMCEREVEYVEMILKRFRTENAA